MAQDVIIIYRTWNKGLSLQKSTPAIDPGLLLHGRSANGKIVTIFAREGVGGEEGLHTVMYCSNCCLGYRQQMNRAYRSIINVPQFLGPGT